MVLSLPKPDLYPLAWLALVPLLLVVGSTTGFRAGISGYAAGFVFFSGTFYWITQTMIVYGGLAASTAFGVGLLFATVYAVYFAAFALGLHYFVRKLGTRGLLLAAPLWVTLELIRTHVLFGGFPWMLSGYSLVPYSGILQMAAWTGIYGLSFLATAVNSILALSIVRRSIAWGAAAVAIIAIAWTLPILGEAPSGESIDVRIVQTNIALDQPWVKPASDALLDELHSLSTSKHKMPQLIVWPETPAPFFLSEDPAFQARAQRIA